MRNISIIFLIIFTMISCQKEMKKDATLGAKNFQSDLIAFYNSDQSPIKIENRKDFKGLTFFPVDKKYQVEVNFTKIQDGKVLEFQTSSGKIKKYVRYGKIAFEFDGKTNELTLFQKSPVDSDHPNHLFLPFNDRTNGVSSYGGGRYIDLNLDDIKDKFLIDFNKTYNPYCAYEDGYSCPIPPSENRLDIGVEAGVSYLEEEH
ncbi:hypothetical protein UJ101_02343 [Flavobacteriaceae bacterium UJ101]|nr:hypothetical protein UJ101_02343 [Flavobacteriaceae bacterium UJ101]